MAVISADNLADEAQRLTALSEAGLPQETEFEGKIANGQVVAMCLGALLSLDWVLGEGESPSEAIKKKVAYLESLI